MPMEEIIRDIKCARLIDLDRTDSLNWKSMREIFNTMLPEDVRSASRQIAEDRKIRTKK